VGALAIALMLEILACKFVPVHFHDRRLLRPKRDDLTGVCAALTPHPPGPADGSTTLGSSQTPPFNPPRAHWATPRSIPFRPLPCRPGKNMVSCHLRWNLSPGGMSAKVCDPCWSSGVLRRLMRLVQPQA
jgi:hypothetical protein